MMVKDPLTELLAIKLYEHDHQGKWGPGIVSWAHLDEKDRELYREIARGERDFGTDT
jgi:hypothetical protein